MSFTSEGKKLVALCGGRHVHAFSVPDLQELKKVEASETAYELAIDAGGERVLVYQTNNEFVEMTKTTLSAYDTQSGAARWQLPFSGTQVWREVAFSDAGSLALVAGPQELLFVNTATGQVAQSLPVKSASDGRPRLLSDDYFAIGNEPTFWT